MCCGGDSPSTVATPAPLNAAAIPIRRIVRQCDGGRGKDRPQSGGTNRDPNDNPLAGEAPDSYLDLVKRHPLKSIRTESELDTAQAVIDELLRQKLDDGAMAYLMLFPTW